MRQFNKTFFPFLALLLSIPLLGQDTTSQAQQPFLQKSSWVAIPIVFYTPETRLGGGAASLYSFRFRGQDQNVRPSQVQLGFAYTQEKQILSYLPFQLLLGADEYRMYGELGYYQYFYQFFGIGNNTFEENSETYSANYPRIRWNFLKNIRPHLFLGFSYWYDNYQIIEREAEGQLINNAITGSQGGVISALGIVSNYDTRDNLFFPTKGELLEVLILNNGEYWGSDFNYTRISIDGSKYFPVNLEKEKVFALNVFFQFHAGNPPFQQLAFIGGTKKMRGFFEGRHRDRQLWMTQGEYRFPLFWRLGGVLFAGIGSVAPSVEDLFTQQIHYSFGTGLRVRLSRKDKINVRIDVGIDEELNILPYITVGEAF